MLFTFEMSSAHALEGVNGVAFFISIDEQLQYNRGCYFPHANYASLGLSLFVRLNINK